jgi:hypothetical protein
MEFVFVNLHMFIDVAGQPQRIWNVLELHFWAKVILDSLYPENAHQVTKANTPRVKTARRSDCKLSGANVPLTRVV